MDRALYDRHADAYEALVNGIRIARAVTSVDLRESILRRECNNPDLASYVALVANASFRITPEIIEALKTAGLTEDAIFEVSIAAAVGAAARQLEAGMTALREAAQ
jgi:hypothetical protein